MSWTYYRGSPTSWSLVPYNFVLTGRVLFTSLSVMLVTWLGISVKKKKISSNLHLSFQRYMKRIRNSYLVWIPIGLFSYFLIIYDRLEKTSKFQGSTIFIITFIFFVFAFVSAVFIGSFFDS